MAVTLPPSRARRSPTTNRNLGWAVLIAVSAVLAVWVIWPEGESKGGSSGPDERLEKSAQEARGGSGSVPPPVLSKGTSQEVPPSLPKEESLVAHAADLVREAESSGDEHRLRGVIGALVLDERLSPAYRESLLTRADELNRKLVFSPSKAPGFVSVAVKPGDSYWKISSRLASEKSLKVSAGLLEALNGVPSARLRAGTVVKVPTGKVSLLVDKSDFAAYVLVDGAYLLRFPVGIGRQGLTPEGSFLIQGKTSNPTWTDPKTGKVYKFGEPGHIIGSRWLGFTQEGRRLSYGIHGTVEPDSVGKAASEGCIRMLNADVERLFDLLAEGTEVLIRA